MNSSYLTLLPPKSNPLFLTSPLSSPQCCSFPMIFHNCRGKDEREERSPSWFNVAEAACVVTYVRALLDIKTNRYRG